MTALSEPGTEIDGGRGDEGIREHRAGQNLTIAALQEAPRCDKMDVKFAAITPTSGTSSDIHL